MGTDRHNRIPQPFDPKAANRPCCYCGKTRPEGRRRWCSDACVDDFLVRKGNAARIRFLVHRRDKGVCALCGWDSAMLERVLRRLGWQAVKFLHTKLDIGISQRRTMWDADHVVPVVEGGGGCGLDGYRTLCIWCHRAETDALAKRRAAQRQADKRAENALLL